MELKTYAPLVLAALLTWLFGRVQRTSAAMDRLFASKAVKSLLYQKSDRDALLKGSEPERSEYFRKCVMPAVGEIERFAAMVTPRRVFTHHSFGVVEGTCSLAVRSLWEDKAVRCVVQEGRDRPDSEKVFLHFEVLALWLRCRLPKVAANKEQPDLQCLVEGLRRLDLPWWRVTVFRVHHYTHRLRMRWPNWIKRILAALVFLGVVAVVICWALWTPPPPGVEAPNFNPTGHPKHLSEAT